MIGLFKERLTPVLQAETSECGLACLSMLLAFHKRHIPLRDLRAAHPAPDAGVNLQKLMRIATDQGLAARAIRLELSELEELQLPCILHWDYGHFVVLERVGRFSCTLVDPAVGRRKYSRSEISQHFTGVALELSPTLEFKTEQSAKQLSLKDFVPSRPCLLYTSPSPRDRQKSRMPSSA